MSQTIKVLLLGNGAREHAIAEALKRSTKYNVDIYAYMNKNNPGIAALSRDVKIGPPKELSHVLEFATTVEPDFCIIGPEEPIVDGAADALSSYGLKSVAPFQLLAELESSKSFTRELMSKHAVPGQPKFRVFTSLEGIEDYIKELNGQIVVKGDGLAGGKGVKVMGDHLQDVAAALAFADTCITKFGAVVIEEKLVGEEFSLMSFSDGKTLVDMPPIQDHKRAFVNDEGPNTGGMGSYNDRQGLPFLNAEDLQQASDINKKAARALQEHFDMPYHGILYGGFIATKDGVKLIEYNIRFGDPEGINALALLETDFVDVCKAIIEERLHELNITFAQKATVLKYVVPEGYPDNPKSGEIITLSSEQRQARLYYASVDLKDGNLVLSSSRAIALLGIGETLAEAEQQAEQAIQTISGPVFYRKDIGTADLIQKRVAHMQALRNG